MHKHINKNADIIQVQCQNKSFTGNIYINPQDKADLGKVFFKMCECIKHKIYIVTVPNGPNSLLSVVNPSYYRLVFNEETGIFADAYPFF